jgi:ligand-binding sensor domain-containing protein
MKKFHFLVALAIINSLTTINVFSFTIKNTGYSLVKNYPKETYGAATQNWDITQDNEGILYFANSKGLLQFDGNNWNLYPLPNKSIVRAVCLDNDGKIWVGGFNQLGYYSPDKKGELTFHYLVNLLEPQYRDFGEIWKIYNDNDRLLIQTFTSILEFKDGLLRPLIWNVDIHYSFFVNNTLYVKVNNLGLHKLVDNELILVKDGELFEDLTVSSIVAKNYKENYIITANEGIFLMSESGIKKLQTPANNFLVQNQVFDAITFENYIIIGTIQDGLLILDNNCQPIQHINRERGLQNNTVLSLFVDREKNLWLGLDNGIDYVKINSPLTYIANQDEIGAGYQALFCNGKLYLGSNQGLYSLQWPAVNPFYTKNNLTSIPGLQGQVWMIKKFEDLLFCGHDRGTFIVNDEKAIQISEIAGASNLFKLSGTEYLIQGTYSGLIILVKNPGSNKWVFQNKVEGFNNSAKSLFIDSYNNIWIGHGYKGIYKLSLNDDCSKVLKQKHYGKEQGLPENYGLNLLLFEDQLVISSEEGYFYYNKEKDYFLPQEALNNTFKDKVVTSFLSDPNNKNTWFFSNDIMGIIKPNFDGSYNIEYIPFLELSEKFLTSYESIYFLDNTSIIIST